MMELSLVKSNDPILTTATEKFDFANPPCHPVELYEAMGNFMVEKGGVGLAAPQVGLPYRFFVIASNPIIGCFNPIIVHASAEKSILEEGCLSFPGVVLKIKRPQKIRVRYTEPNGNIVTKSFEGITARVFQHELDHLDGIIFKNHISPLKRSMAEAKARKMAKKGFTLAVKYNQKETA